MRMTSCLSIGVGSRLCENFPKPSRLTILPKYRSDSAREKFSTVTGVAVGTLWLLMDIAASFSVLVHSPAALLERVLDVRPTCRTSTDLRDGADDRYWRNAVVPMVAGHNATEGRP